MQVSFGKRIPLYKCQVKDMETGKNIPAVISEYDCNDITDMYEMAGLGYKWKFALCIAADMRSKFDYNTDPRFTKRNYPLNFYILHETEQDKYGDVNILGICETENSDNNVNISFIESKFDKKHKYIGQTLLAAVGKILLNRNGHNMYITTPAYNVIPYYINKCGFEQLNKNKYAPLWMETEHIKKFIQRTEDKTGSKLINVMG